MKFDERQYETVKQRKKKFYADYPDGRIIVSIMTPDTQFENYALFKASIYITNEDQERNLPKATGYAMEIRDKELSVSGKGTTYESVNYTSWTENCEESAIGRALDNAGYAGNDKCSLEEMNKAQKHHTQFSKMITEKQLNYTKYLINKLKTFGEPPEELQDEMMDLFGKKKREDLTLDEAAKIINDWTNRLKCYQNEEDK